MLLDAALGVRFLQGSGHGCPYPDGRPSAVRRIYQNLTVWVLPADFVSTTLAFLYQDFLRILPPYSLTSAPVIFGTVGGIALIIGTAGFIFLKAKSDPDPEASGALGMDYVFLITLRLAAFTGMLTPYFSLNSRYGNNPYSTFSFYRCVVCHSAVWKVRALRLSSHGFDPL